MTMKKFSILLVIILLFAVTACGTGGKIRFDIVNELDNIYTNSRRKSI